MTEAEEELVDYPAIMYNVVGPGLCSAISLFYSAILNFKR